jgi:hypothetical protein
METGVAAAEVAEKPHHHLQHEWLMVMMMAWVSASPSDNAPIAFSGSRFAPSAVEKDFMTPCHLYKSDFLGLDLNSKKQIRAIH